MGPVVIIVIILLIFVLIGVSQKKSQPKSIFGSDFEKRLDEAQERRNSLVAKARTKDDDYGYTPTNPVMESSVHTSYSFLERLQTSDGKEITYERVGAMMINFGDQEAMVDKYKLFVDGEEYKTIYICAYGHALGIAPKGMQLAQRN